MVEATQHGTKRRSLSRQPTIDRAALQRSCQEVAHERLLGTSFRDGTLLPNLAKAHLVNFEKLNPLSGQKPLWGRRTWGTLCSGSEGAHFCMKACQDAMNDRRATLGQEAVEFRQLFACESDPKKQRWIHHIINHGRKQSGLSEICIFCNALDMGNDKAECFTHGGALCPVPDVDVLILSTSCKDLSCLSKHKSSSAAVLALHHSLGGTADTFRGGFLSYLDNHKASVIFYENSDHLADDGNNDNKNNDGNDASNLDIFRAELPSRNFEGQSFILNGKLFGLPAQRRRFFAAYVSTISDLIDFSSRSVFDQFRTVAALLTLCRRRCPRICEVLLDTADPILESERVRRLARPKQPLGTWVVEHQKEYTKYLKTWGAKPPCAATARSTWLETLTESQKSILVLHQYRLIVGDTELVSKRAKKSVAGSAQAGRMMPRLMVDLNPSISRFTSSTHDDENDVEIAPCILPQQVLWLHFYGDGQEPRPMVGIESMLLQGWPVLQVLEEDQPWMNDTLFQSLAGNGVPLPILVALLSSTFEGISWVGPACERLGNDEDDAIQSAIALLHGVQSSTGGLRPGSAIGGQIARRS